MCICVSYTEVFIQFTNPNERMIVSEGQGSVEVCLLLRGYTTRSLAVNVYTRGVTAEGQLTAIDVLKALLKYM